MAVDQNLANLSNMLVYSAMVVYTGSLGAFATDLSGRGGVGNRERARLAVERERVAAGGPAPSIADRAPVTPAPDRPDRPGYSDRPDRPAAGRSKAGGIAVSLTWLALLLHGGGVVARGLSVSRPPWGNMYEFAVSGSVVVTAVFVGVLLRRDVRYLGTFVVGPVLLTLGLAVTVFYTQAAQLVPALHSFWLAIHVSVAFVASALFTLGFSTSILQLVQERREAGHASGRAPRGGRFMDALPPSAELERSAYRLHVVAFPLWTFTVIAGAIWAEAAWGKYWNWDPKEVWSFVIWVVYAGYLHARVTRGWDGRRAAYLALAGYACVLFNFLVVNVFFVGMHSYAGV